MDILKLKYVLDIHEEVQSKQLQMQNSELSKQVCRFFLQRQKLDLRILSQEKIKIEEYLGSEWR